MENLEQQLGEKQHYQMLVLTLNPDSDQKKLLDINLNGSRFVYNQCVEQHLNYLNQSEEFKKSNHLKYKDYQELRAEHKFLYDCDQWCLQQQVRQYKLKNKANQKKRLNGTKVGNPRFKSRKFHDDYYFCNNQKVKLHYDFACKANSCITIPKVGHVKFLRKSIPQKFLDGQIKQCTVKRVPTGEYRIALSIEIDIDKLKKPRKENGHQGLDMSLTSFYVDNFGATAPDLSRLNDNLNYNLKKLDKLNQKFSSTRTKLKDQSDKSSKRHHKHAYSVLRTKLAKLYNHIQNMKIDYINKLAKSLCEHNELICIESLDLDDMKIHHKKSDQDYHTGGNHGKSIQRQKFSFFIKKLNENAEIYGTTIVHAHKYFASTQICSNCGKRNRQMKDVTIRKLKCIHCGFELDRDHNSAINLKKYGERCLRRKLQKDKSDGKDLSHSKGSKE